MPAARPELWVRARDLVYDWIEKQEDALGVAVDMAVLGPPLRDRRWKFSAYVRGVYLAGKTLYVLDHPGSAGHLAAELAAVDAIIRFHEVTQPFDMGTSRAVLKYERKKKNGKLEAYLRKRRAKVKK